MMSGEIVSMTQYTHFHHQPETQIFSSETGTEAFYKIFSAYLTPTQLDIILLNSANDFQFLILSPCCSNLEFLFRKWKHWSLCDSDLVEYISSLSMNHSKYNTVNNFLKYLWQCSDLDISSRDMNWGAA